MIRPGLTACLATIVAAPLAAQRPAIPDSDRYRLAEAFRVSAAIGDSIWPGWNAVPFSILLVTEDREFLVRPVQVPEGFDIVGHDSVLGNAVWTRPRVYAPNLLATFPAFGLPPVVVVGLAEQTGKTPEQWLMAVLHEHFHQIQMSDTGYFTAVEALGLAGGDRTGRWMLDHPFPYDSARVGEAYAGLARALATALRAIGTDSLPGRAAPVATAVTMFTDVLSRDDRTYFWFQVWQEGVSRYIEVRAAEAAARWAPSDSISYGALAGELKAAIVHELEGPDLAQSRRVAFYAVGAALALLLDHTDPTWRERYRTRRFEPFF